MNPTLLLLGILDHVRIQSYYSAFFLPRLASQHKTQLSCDGCDTMPHCDSDSSYMYMREILFPLNYNHPSSSQRLPYYHTQPGASPACLHFFDRTLSTSVLSFPSHLFLQRDFLSNSTASIRGNTEKLRCLPWVPNAKTDSAALFHA